jgi:hypothetical protein
MPQMFSRQNPSPRYVELLSVYRQMHRQSPDSYVGKSLVEHIPEIARLVDKTGAKSLMDYGSGKGLVYSDGSVRKRMGVDTIRCYDPGVQEHSTFPQEQQFDGVISTDALEHIPAEDVPWVIDEMFTSARAFVFATVGSYPAKKTLPNGENAHACQNPWTWWRSVVDTASKRHPSILYRFLVEIQNHSIKFLPGRHSIKVVTNERSNGQ